MPTLFYSLPVPLWIAGMLLAPALADANDYPDLDRDQTAWIGDQIFNNECNRQAACLTAWNAGETFPSLGIGHFIWYRAGQREIFEESFPRLLGFLREQGVALPAWLSATNPDAPWPDREAFLADADSQRMTALRAFLLAHKTEQTDFIISRFDRALAAMTTALADESSTAATRTRLTDNFFRVANSAPPHGLYALIDYVNFKGIGVSTQERYAGQGWGLRQVLLAMDADRPPLAAFVDAASAILATRVQNAPPERNEGRWLVGWRKRLGTYLPATPQTTPAQTP